MKQSNKTAAKGGAVTTFFFATSECFTFSRQILIVAPLIGNARSVKDPRNERNDAKEKPF
jgi:hypothetical protein